LHENIFFIDIVSIILFIIVCTTCTGIFFLSHSQTLYSLQTQKIKILIHLNLKTKITISSNQMKTFYENAKKNLEKMETLIIPKRKIKLNRAKQKNNKTKKKSPFSF